MASEGVQFQVFKEGGIKVREHLSPHCLHGWKEPVE